MAYICVVDAGATFGGVESANSHAETDSNGRGQEQIIRLSLETSEKRVLYAVVSTYL